MVPEDGAASPAISLSMVDFPQPDGPSRLTNSPGRIVRSTPAMAVTPLAKVLKIPASRSSGRVAATDNVVSPGRAAETSLRGATVMSCSLRHEASHLAEPLPLDLVRRRHVEHGRRFDAVIAARNSSIG